MKKLTVVLISVIFTTLIIGSIQLISADHLEPGLGIFKNEKEINTISTEDSKYQIYVTVEIRNVQGELISVTEATNGYYISHEITDESFDKCFGANICKKEIVVIDNKKYEKVPFAQKYGIESSEPKLQFKIRVIVQEENVLVDKNLFSIFVPLIWMEEGDVIDTKWNVFREFN